MESIEAERRKQEMQEELEARKREEDFAHWLISAHSGKRHWIEMEGSGCNRM